jgi:hypothetical protein
MNVIDFDRPAVTKVPVYTSFEVNEFRGSCTASGPAAEADDMYLLLRTKGIQPSFNVSDIISMPLIHASTTSQSNPNLDC